MVIALVQLAGARAANLEQHDVHALAWPAYILLLAGPAALVLRRQSPFPVLALTLSAAAAYLISGYGYGPIFLSVAVAFLTAAVVGSRWWTYPLLPLAYLLTVWPLPALLDHPTTPWQQFAAAGWLTVLLATAEGIRQRRTVIEARAQRAEAARRDEEAQRELRASEERLAIARELHDVLAQSLSLIDLQSSVALELFEEKPAQAVSALTTINSASKEALARAQTMLEKIRPGSAPEEIAPRADLEPEPDGASSNGHTPQPAPAPRPPTPSIEDLDNLLQRPRTAGLTVDTKVIGTREPLPSVLDAAAVRIIQESLTNVVRHAPGACATVTVRYTPESVDLTIDNTRPTGRSTTGPGGRNGIIGMRERAHALGGQLTAGPRPSGGFRVAARLPNRLQSPEPPEPVEADADTAAAGVDRA
ncbi:sensor histidine kinase [Nocardia sp. NEAU-351]|uniref:histidine kinase n=1 Tax=Nocardia bovistercoris TaxID=2785916 RepID=A0A931IIL7_9NOCA|nr:sensor histidine kinase [Nocardia bovistercoris]